MPSPLHGLRPPYRLASNIVYFHDWRYVDHGYFAWKDANGRGMPLWSSEPVPPLMLEHHNIPTGISLIAQRATKSEPILTPEVTREPMIGPLTVVHEQGRYRLWYEATNVEDIGNDRMGLWQRLRYAESDDGMTWRLPEVGIVEHKGSKKNNIVYGGTLTPETGYHGGCVFVDPSAPPKERYKAFHLGHVLPEVIEDFRRKRPDAVDPFLLHEKRIPAIYGATSPDGLCWTAIPDPLVVQTSDTHNVCTYDAATQKYVAYVRSWFFHRRTIGRMETDDFRRFPLPEELVWPNAMMPPYDLWYTNGKTMMPLTSDYHVMFPMRWTLPEDKFDFHLMTSPDGIVWGFVPGGPVCEPGARGTWDAGVVGAQLGLVRLPGKRMGVLYNGTPVPHKYPRCPPLGAGAWALWPEGRLVALHAPQDGSFQLHPLLFQGREVHLNFRTAIAGFVQIEALGPDGQPLPGHSFADCDLLNGDELDRVVTWRGRADLGHADGAPVRLRFRMRSADLFSVEFKG